MHPTNSSKNKRFLTLLLSALGLVALLSLTFSRSSSSSPGSPLAHSDSTPIDEVPVSKDVLKGDVISSKIGNETLKAELGRAAWRVLHTTMAKFPDKPTADEQTALASYLHLFARLYPWYAFLLSLSLFSFPVHKFASILIKGSTNSCECAAHFREILAKFPPQVSTRSNAAAWACHVHNEVNKSLKKELFDCSNIGDFYDCGCADEVAETMGKKGLRTAAGERIDLGVERNG